ncbi:MAG: general secretion pathway protein GspK [Gammaproteobacteria bacterium]|nr:general secretion pathway protein GspK [Gammaproteobacteria bacterium]
MKSPRKHAGMALVIILWFIALLSLLALGFSKAVRTDTMVARNLVDSMQAKHLAAAAVEKGVYGLLNPDQAVINALISSAPVELKLGDAQLSFTLQDENGKLDINHAPLELVENLLVTQGVAEDTALAISHALGDWRDENDLKQLYGAERREYIEAGMAWTPSNAPFRSIREIRHLLGMTSRIYNMIAPLITVYGSSEKINPQFAPRALLAAIPGIDAVELENYIDARESLSAEQVPAPAALPLLTSVESSLSGKAGPVYTVFGRARLPSGSRATRRLVIWIPEQNQDRPYFVLDAGQDPPPEKIGEDEQ